MLKHMKCKEIVIMPLHIWNILIKLQIPRQLMIQFKAGTFELSHKFLNKFYRKSKNIDTKELLDIARVNLGMIDGTQDMESYINKIKSETYEQFLKTKIEYSQQNQ